MKKLLKHLFASFRFVSKWQHTAQLSPVINQEGFQVYWLSFCSCCKFFAVLSFILAVLLHNVPRKEVRCNLSSPRLIPRLDFVLCKENNSFYQAPVNVFLIDYML